MNSYRASVTRLNQIVKNVQQKKLFRSAKRKSNKK